MSLSTAQWNWSQNATRQRIKFWIKYPGLYSHLWEVLSLHIEIWAKSESCHCDQWVLMKWAQNRPVKIVQFAMCTGTFSTYFWWDLYDNKCRYSLLYLRLNSSFCPKSFLLLLSAIFLAAQNFWKQFLLWLQLSRLLLSLPGKRIHVRLNNVFFLFFLLVWISLSCNLKLSPSLAQN